MGYLTLFYSGKNDERTMKWMDGKGIRGATIDGLAKISGWCSSKMGEGWCKMEGEARRVSKLGASSWDQQMISESSDFL